MKSTCTSSSSVRLLLALLIGTLGTAQAITMLPPNPCPKVVSYRTVGDYLEAVLHLDNDFSGEYRVSVSGSVPIHSREDESAKMTITAEKPEPLIMSNRPSRKLTYVVRFPSRSNFPKITAVSLNDAEMCSSNPWTPVPGLTIRNMRASYKTTTQKTSVPDSSSRSRGSMPYSRYPDVPDMPPTRMSYLNDDMDLPYNYPYA